MFKWIKLEDKIFSVFKIIILHLNGFIVGDLWHVRLLLPVWPELAIFCTLGNFLKPFATMNLPKSTTFLGNLSKGAKIIHFSNEIIFGQHL